MSVAVLTYGESDFAIRRRFGGMCRPKRARCDVQAAPAAMSDKWKYVKILEFASGGANNSLVAECQFLEQKLR
jgi:hypothetical protein